MKSLGLVSRPITELNPEKNTATISTGGATTTRDFEKEAREKERDPIQKPNKETREREKRRAKRKARGSLSQPLIQR